MQDGRIFFPHSPAPASGYTPAGNAVEQQFPSRLNRKGNTMNLRRASLLTFLLSVPALAQQPAQQTPSMWGSVVPMMVVMFVIIYFLMIRPEQKKQKNRQKMINEIKKGDRVVTIGGIFGTVGNVKDGSIMVKIADNTVVEVRKGGIAEVVADKSEDIQQKDGKK